MLRLKNVAMQKDNADWSEAEQTIFQEALDKAYVREANALIQEIRATARDISHLDHVWSLYNYLGTKRHKIDSKYGDRNSFSTFILAQLIHEGWLTMDDLIGLGMEKVVTISVFVRIGYLT